MCSNIATNLNLTDMETCYKAFSRQVIEQIQIKENRFGFEPEITAKVAKAKLRIFEVGISNTQYTSYGKDWVQMVFALYGVFGSIISGANEHQFNVLLAWARRRL